MHHAGDRFVTPVLEEFAKPWTGISQTVPELNCSGGKNTSRFKQILLYFGDVSAFCTKGGGLFTLTVLQVFPNPRAESLGALLIPLVHLFHLLTLYSAPLFQTVQKYQGIS